MTIKPDLLRRALFMFALIVAGEAVFALPFHLTRFFRPTVLEVFSLTATQLGAAQGVYGILAMLAYFPGGPLADRFPARKLLAVSLWTTALGGLYMATFPDYQGSLLLWGVFGITTILFFWAAMIRATRDWGGHDSQGRAFGLLDGGRGLLAAVLASLGVLSFSIAFPEGYGQASLAQKEDALRLVIYGYTAVTAAAGVLAWYAIADEDPRPKNTTTGPTTGLVTRHILSAMKIPAIWIQALIVLCAYVGYKGFDNYGLFAVQAYGLDEVEAARIITIGSWMRPIAALGAGMVGDRFNVSKTIAVLFALLLATDLYFGIATPTPGAAWAMLSNTLLTCIAMFGIRGLYFALFEETKVPMAVTGTAAGIVSVIGFTPDIFVALVAGILIDSSPGLAGHQHFFLFLAGFAFVGFLASFALARVVSSNNTDSKQQLKFP